MYLEAIRFALESGVGSRGSAIAIDPGGQRVHARLGADWTIAPENPAFRDKVQETVADAAGRVEHRWVDRRPLPEETAWFETGWAAFRKGEIYD